MSPCFLDVAPASFSDAITECIASSLSTMSLEQCKNNTAGQPLEVPYDLT
jgi:hypothetical protein